MNKDIEDRNNVQKAITEVMAFFDLFDFPMTAFEIWQNISIKCEYGEINQALSTMEDKIQLKNGTYFFIGREEIVAIRSLRYSYADRKFKKALWITRLFKIIPWIKMVGVGNIFGANNLKETGDIDFIVITEKNRVWLARFFCVGIAKFLRLRPMPGETRDKICLSFFADEDSLNLEKLMLARDNTTDLPDLNFIYWVAGITPIYDKNKIYDKFFAQNNWLKNFLPNWQGHSINYLRNAGGGYSQFYRDVVDMFIGGLEKHIKLFSLKIMPPRIKDMMNKDTRVVVNDSILKFHTNDRREEVRRKYIEKISNFKFQIPNQVQNSK